MAYSEEIKKIRQKCFLSQEAFARELGVSFSSINRWEGGKSKPNMSAMKRIMEFCEAHTLDFSTKEFAVNATKEEGEYYTPHDVVQLIASMIEPYDGTLYDEAVA